MRHFERPSARQRLAAGLSGLIALLVSAILAQGFGLNGSQYDGWVRSFWLFAVATFAWTVAAMFLQPRVSPTRIATASLGLIVAATAMATTVSRYSDPYQGPDRWPNALAWIGLIGLLAIPAAISAPRLREHRPSRSPAGA